MASARCPPSVRVRISSTVRHATRAAGEAPGRGCGAGCEAGGVLRRALPLALAASALSGGLAHARVLVLADGRPSAALLDVLTNRQVARVALPAPGTMAATGRSGTAAYVAAGSAIARLDLSVTPAPGVFGADGAGAVGAPLIPAPRLKGLGEPVRGLAAATGGGPVIALGARRLFVLDPGSLRRLGSVGLKGTAVGTLGVSVHGALAAVPLRGGRVAIVDAGARRLLRRVKVKGAAGAAIDARGITWVAARGRLFAIPPGARRAAKRPLRLGRGLGGALALSPDRTRLAAGATGGAQAVALVDLLARRVSRIHVGAGPGVPSWSPDGARLYVADRGARTSRWSAPSPSAASAPCACPTATRRASRSSPGPRASPARRATTSSAARGCPTGSRASPAPIA